MFCTIFCAYVLCLDWHKMRDLSSKILYYIYGFNFYWRWWVYSGCVSTTSCWVGLFKILLLVCQICHIKISVSDIEVFKRTIFMKFCLLWLSDFNISCIINVFLLGLTSHQQPWPFDLFCNFYGEGRFPRWIPGL